MGQQGLQPTPQDPKLWLVECKTGSEREAVISLMQKCMDLASKGAPLAIKSVFTQDHLKVCVQHHVVLMLLQWLLLYMYCC